jgi:hypothetical protein
MKLNRFLWITIGFFAALSVFPIAESVRADEIPIGYIAYSSFQFDANGNLITTTLSVNNFTGDPTLGGFALPPDFPVVTFLNIDDATLTLEGPSAPSSPISLGTLAPGPLLDPLGDPLTSLTFAAGSTFTSALLEGTLSTTTVTLADGTVVNLSPTISTVLLPSLGGSLTPDLDVALIEANTAPVVPTPEPPAIYLMALGMLCLVVAKFVRGS